MRLLLAFAGRVIWLLNELGLKCEMRPVDILAGETKGEEFRTLNPAAKVPVLVDGDIVLTESAAIQFYLAERHPESRFIPESVDARAQIYRWIKDKWGLNWQITPRALTEAVNDPDRKAAKRAFDAMMTMKKIDIAKIEAARRG